uniref:Pentacotripeptide-repeat region of PRORP domain-containing protein n=1 Tax=Mycena chlorophos TaxID=658473 RepID=A0ABQ0M7Z7_MYCCL|nr:predicted protein [Mycena chlorophos]
MQVFLRRQYATARHHVPKQTQTLHPLEPHTLSARLKKLADKNQLDLAVSMLKNAPLAAQNTPVWNTLIWECAKARRYKLAYELFVDMKRRGFNPTTRTFQTMFTGLSHIDNWSSYTMQLKNARSLYSQYQRHVEDLRKRDPSSPELAVDPIPAYVTVLGNAKQYDELFALYYVASKSAPPTKFLFTAIFKALSTHVSTEQDEKNAADARVLWREALKIPNLDIDGVMVTSAIQALSRGQSSEKKLAFQIMREYFGLSLSGEPATAPKVPLSSASLAAALSLCATSDTPEEAIHIFRQVLKRPPADGGANIVDRLHMETVFKALQPAGLATLALETLDWMQASSKLAPTRWAYQLVLLTCEKAADWNIATRVFGMMSGYHPHDFVDGAVAPIPRLRQRADAYHPDAETMSCMLRIARATDNCAHMRQCLRMTTHLDSVGDGLFARESAKTVSVKSLKTWAFSVVKLAEAVVETVDFVAANGPSTSIAEVDRWGHLRRVAMGVLSQKPESTPPLKPKPRDRKATTKKRAHKPTQTLTAYEKSFAA